MRHCIEIASGSIGLDQITYSQVIACFTESRDHSNGCPGGHGPMAKGLSSVDVRQVNLDNRNPDCQDSVADGDRGVRISRGIHNHTIDILPGGTLELIDDFALMIRLNELDHDVGKRRSQLFLEIGQRGSAIDLRFAITEKIQIRAVDDQDAHAVNVYTRNVSPS